MTAMDPEFSRPVTLESSDDLDITHEIEAGEEERKALAARFGLVALGSLAAHFHLTSVGGGSLVRLNAALAADLTQACVVSLEPVESHIEASFIRLFDPEGIASPPDEEGLTLATDEEVAEPMADGIIDLGEIVTEQLALEINPFPRAPGVDFHDFLAESKESGNTEIPSPAGPFATLAKLVKDNE